MRPSLGERSAQRKCSKPQQQVHSSPCEDYKFGQFAAALPEHATQRAQSTVFLRCVGEVARALGCLVAVRKLKRRVAEPNYSVKWTAAVGRSNLTRTVAAATYLKRYGAHSFHEVTKCRLALCLTSF